MNQEQFEVIVTKINQIITHLEQILAYLEKQVKDKDKKTLNG